MVINYVIAGKTVTMSLGFQEVNAAITKHRLTAANRCAPCSLRCARCSASQRDQMNCDLALLRQISPAAKLRLRLDVNRNFMHVWFYFLFFKLCFKYFVRIKIQLCLVFIFAVTSTKVSQ